MNPIRRKMSSFLTKVARKGLETLNTQSFPCAKGLSKVEVDDIVANEIEKICNAATLAEITKTLLLVRQLKKTSGQKKEAIKNDLNRIVEELLTRVETESGQLRLPKACHHLFLGF